MSPETATCPICKGEFDVSPYGSDRHVYCSDRHVYCSRRCRELARLQRDHAKDAAAQARLAAGANPDIVIGKRTSVKQNPNPPTLSGAATGQALEPAAPRSCPHCGEAITIFALLTTPEAARPALPMGNSAGSGVIPIRRA
ncbi:hypothetical protein [Catenulispora subtropica]|uniref:Uncharacterized protein n=1 Tax=Catenulispora subtropica TaxID=450798 RepID=A0ABP5EBC6_9ACTN